VTSLINHTLKHTVLPQIDGFLTTDYELKEADYLEREQFETFVIKFVDVMQNEAGVLRKRLSDTPYQYVILALLHTAVPRLEQHVMKKKFTFWGGLQFDRDVRQLMGYFSSISDAPIRDKFTRLVQMASVLQLEKASEIVDFWKSNNEANLIRLQKDEVKFLLLQRSDFKAVPKI